MLGMVQGSLYMFSWGFAQQPFEWDITIPTLEMKKLGFPEIANLPKAPQLVSSRARVCLQPNHLATTLHPRAKPTAVISWPLPWKHFLAASPLMFFIQQQDYLILSAQS